MKKRIFKFKGLTILEVILAVSIFSMLSTLVFYIFAISSSSWLKTRETVEVKESAQVVLTRIEKELRASAYQSIAIIEYPSGSGNNAISFLSGLDETTGRTIYDEDTGKMEWKKFVIFYLEDDPKIVKEGYYQLFSRDVLIGEFVDNFATTSLDWLPYPPLESTDEDSIYEVEQYLDGTVPAMTYVQDPRSISRNVTGLNFKLGAREVDIVINTGKPVNPVDPNSEASPEKMTLRSTVYLRNL